VDAANSSISAFTVTGLSGLSRFVDGSAVVIAGNGANFRTAYYVTPATRGCGSGFPHAAIASVTGWRDQPYFTASSRLFRGEPGVLEMLDMPTFANEAPFRPTSRWRPRKTFWCICPTGDLPNR